MNSLPWPFLIRTKAGRSGSWGWVTSRETTFALPALKCGGSYEFLCAGKTWGSLRNRAGLPVLTIAKGYAFDGATCAPDFERVMPAVLVHDFLYQFLETGVGEPWTRKDADLALLFLARQCRFRLAWIYYAAVRVFGWWFARRRRKRRSAPVLCALREVEKSCHSNNTPV